MIKEYFTDGLIGLAIILSIFRTDLVGINNLINYPEVQDIILGQTAAYLPTNFHRSPHSFVNPKHLDFDNQAFSAWYQNINNLPLFRERRQYDIEAFLVSLSPQNVNMDDLTESTLLDESNVQGISSHALVDQSNNSLAEEEQESLNPERSNATNEAVLDIAQPVPDVYSVLNMPLPGCNLTKEDLKLIDILYQQDVDLGVGKEVFDPSFREELERERELEFVKQQEMQKAQLLAKEKKERETKELQDRWLKKNFRRDGETGEWVQLQNWTVGSSSDLSAPFLIDPGENLQESFTLEDALDFLGNLEKANSDIDASTSSDCPLDSAQELQMQQFEMAQEQEQLPGPFLDQQDSLEESWNGLVDYLNMTENSIGERSSNDTLLQLSDEQSTPLAMMSDLEQDADLQADYLIHNATLPSVNMDLSNEFSVLTPMEEFNSSMPHQSADINSIMDFDLSFFNNLTTLQNESRDGMGLAEGDDPFGDVQDTNNEILMDGTLSLADNMDAIQMLKDNLNTHAVPPSESGSPAHEFGEVFDALEGATGGSDYNSDNGDMNGHFSKVSYLSESSNDSGFINPGGFSSSSSSTPSSYAGSPAGSQNGLNSSASNDTEHDPHGTRAVAHQHVAHNHTYNTPPGQVPREVKKYAQKEPSRKGPQSRDQRRAEELKIPFTLDDIIETPVESFNEMLASHKLTEAQLILIRDIRRRGKNKVAAQNCRKRKVGVIFSLNDEMTDLQRMRDQLMAERAAMDRERRRMKEKFGHLYTHIFQSLRDEHGEPYDPSLYSLQQSSDGNVFLVPRNLTVSKNSSSSSSSSPSSSNDSTGSKKRKSFDH